MKTRIKDLREDHDWTQKQVANIIMCDQSLYSKYERDERTIPIDIIVKLAKFYNVSTDYILKLTDNPIPYK